MDFANRGNRPLQQQQQPAQEENTQEHKAAPSNNGGGKKGFDFGKVSSIAVLLGGALIAAVLVVGLVFGDDNKSTTLAESKLIQTDKYQAVFLDSQDGQVYFGNLQIYNDDIYMLTDIYYVRVENPIQPQGEEAQQANISLAKLGSELHAPQDFMFISRDQVLYWENLKDDGQVVTAIKQFEASGGADSTQQQTPSPATGTQPTGTDQQNDTLDETPTTPPAEETTTP